VTMWSGKVDPILGVGLFFWNHSGANAQATMEQKIQTPSVIIIIALQSPILLGVGRSYLFDTRETSLELVQ